MPSPRLLLSATAAAWLAASPATSQEEAAHGEPAAPTAAAAAAASSELPAISVSAVAPVVLRERVIASGLVAAVEEVQVQPLVEGQPIDALLADVGDRVEAGQVLARLSASTLELELSQLRANEASARAGLAQAEASLSQAQANAAEAERQAARNAELAAQGTVPQATADQTRAAAEAARAAVRVSEQGIASAQAQAELVAAQIANAELQLARTEVKAPVAGLVVARNAQVGAISAAAGAAMFTIVRDGAMELRAEVSEQDLLQLAPGQPASLRATAASEPLAGEVRLVEPAIDPDTRLGTARIFIGDTNRVVEGMFLSAEIVVDEGETLAVPATALGTGAEGAFAMRVTDGLVERVAVVPGIRDGDLVGIVEGLAEGDLVVTRAAAFVRDGDRINPVPEGAPADAPADAPEAAASAPPEAALEPTPAAAPAAAPATTAPATPANAPGAASADVPAAEE
jgi:HlyD family secretion protein